MGTLFSQSQRNYCSRIFVIEGLNCIFRFRDGFFLLFVLLVNVPLKAFLIGRYSTTSISVVSCQCIRANLNSEFDINQK